MVCFLTPHLKFTQNLQFEMVTVAFIDDSFTVNNFAFPIGQLFYDLITWLECSV